MNATLSPQSLPELVEAVRSSPRIIPVGGGTKPRLSAVAATAVSLCGLQGMVEYEPSEFTFTAWAGTPVRDVVAAVAERGQYLPFDAPWLAAGSTLGGLVAGGVAGPGRFRFGGVRDFILGIRFVDGAGRLLRLGGKVVKNAAGFDLPKFFVGSAGRFGLLAELTFKVFPQPMDSLTLRLAVNDLAAAATILVQLSGTAWDPEALEVPDGGRAVLVRLAGREPALQAIARKILARWPGEIVDANDATALWTALREFAWVPTGAALVRIALMPTKLEALGVELRSLGVTRCHVGAGGNVAFVALGSSGDVMAFDVVLQRLKLPGMLLRGAGPLWLGEQPRWEIAARVKQALDAETRFPALHD